MRNKKTHSSQTYTSFSDQRKEDDSQVLCSSNFATSTSGTQTCVAKSAGSNSSYEGSKSLIIGLRGDSTFPVEHIVINDIISNSRGTTCGV